MAEQPSDFRILRSIWNIKTIARGRGIRIIDYLEERYGGRNWRKLKGLAVVEEQNGWIGNAEIHWFEAHGIGRVRWKIKIRFPNE